MKQWLIICLCVGSFVSCSKNDGPETQLAPDITVTDDTQLSTDTNAPKDVERPENDLLNTGDSSEESDTTTVGEDIKTTPDSKGVEQDSDGPPPECTPANQAEICKDFNNCTDDLCVAGQCENPAIVGCCKLDKECDDGVPCTVDECNSVKGECIHSLEDNNCCLSTDDCFDGDPCTNEICIAHICVRPQNADCPCVLNSLCNDNNPCTEDQCIKKVCSYSLKGADSCCVKNTDCDDGKAGNYDGCQQGLCWHAPLNCSQNSDCSNTDPCVTATCSNGQCNYQEQSNCCAANADCSDGLTGTEDLCMNGECVYLIAAPKLCTN
ncbi:MAG TPA: hypothetical protein EYN66_01350, partial [Myxococcales bacterium]|nr:hypothetical protein [Myxococcales bacterium]